MADAPAKTSRRSTKAAAATAGDTSPTTAPPEPDLSARILYFPVRHHSPACAFHVRKLIEEIRPSAVLIEGPRDATRLIPFLLRPETRFPVAIYTTYVERTQEGLPARHGAYYPLCDYSPELVALRAAAAVNANAEFIDLTFPEMVRAGRGPRENKPQNLLTDDALLHSRFIEEACRRASVRDADELWDHLYESNYHQRPTSQFIHAVLTYCLLSRAGHSPESMQQDGTLVREAAMSAAIARVAGKTKGRIVVVTGGFHTVVLPQAKGAMPPKVDVADQDALVVLMRYGFEQLDRLNGYASGMPSPAFYQRRWEGRDVSDVFVDLGRIARERQQEVSVADEIAALGHCRRLSAFRGHAEPTREDVFDAVRSCFVKGARDIEGVVILSLARKLLAGEAIGAVPADAGQPPIVEDFRASALRLKIDIDQIAGKECTLDLYRKIVHREMSRFFYRLRFLEVPFAELVRGPDFVAGRDLERIQEVWNYHWSPAAESVLIERSLYGATVEEAAASMLLERFAQAQSTTRRADVAAALLVEACRMGLHRHTQDLLARTGELIAADADFVSLVTAMESLLVLHVSREPLEAHRLTGVSDLAEQAYERALYLFPQLLATPEEQTEFVLSAINGLTQAVTTLGDTSARRDLRHQRFRDVITTPGGNAAIRGAAVGSLYADGALPSDEAIAQLRGHLLAASVSEGPAFLRGLLHTARSILWQLPAATEAIHEVLRSWPDALFIQQLPHLRLALAGLSPRECDAVADAVAKRSGLKKLAVARSGTFTEADVLLAAAVEQRLSRTLAADNLAILIGEAPP